MPRKNESSQKAAMRDIEMEIPRDRKGEYEPQLIKNIKILLLRTWKKKSFLCMQKE